MQFPRDEEELRLLADYEACHREEVFAEAKIANPRRSTLYPTYKRLADSLAAIRLECKEISLAIGALIKKKRPKIT
jgi:hypothetical protein